MVHLRVSAQRHSMLPQPLLAADERLH